MQRKGLQSSFSIKEIQSLCHGDGYNKVKRDFLTCDIRSRYRYSEGVLLSSTITNEITQS